MDTFKALQQQVSLTSFSESLCSCKSCRKYLGPAETGGFLIFSKVINSLALKLNFFQETNSKKLIKCVSDIITGHCTLTIANDRLKR